MDPGLRSPLIDLFRRGEAARDVRVLAAKGALASRELDQLALLVLLSDDPDPEIAAAANGTLNILPSEALQSFLVRPEVPAEMRDFFAARGVAVTAPAIAADVVAPSMAEEGDQEENTADDPTVLASLPIVERMKLASKGTRSQRAQLVRDSNKLVAAAVLSSPKLTESEVEAFAKMANVTEDVLRTIAMNRTWMKNYGVISGLTKNPKTPPGISMQLVQRLNEKDLKALTTDRNVPEAVRLAARKFLRKGPKEV